MRIMRLFERFKLFVNRVTITPLPFAGSTLRQIVPGTVLLVRYPRDSRNSSREFYPPNYYY